MNKNLNVLFSICREKLPQEGKICDDSRQVQKGDLFIAVDGFRNNGHHFIESAVKKGARIIVAENEDFIPKNFKDLVFIVQSTKKIRPVLLNHYYNFPSKKMFCVGITGTNGKTTTSYMIEKIFSDGGWQTGVIGTINHRIGDQEWPSSLTTPAPVEIHQRLNQFYLMNARAVVMEVSSIGLDQYRVDDICFNLAVFTNLGHDHLDYHKNRTDYFKAKKRFFEVVRNSTERNYRAVLNHDDPHFFNECRKICRMPFVSYGINGVDFRYKILKESLDFIEFNLEFQRKKHHVCLPVLGSHNVSNAVASLAVAVLSGFSLEKACRSLESFQSVPGRLQRIPSSEPFFVFVDYAHTPDALKHTLSALQNVKSKNKKMITVFGCGGQRDQGKRVAMARTVEKDSDYIVVTSDNPRNEDAYKIVEDIFKGFQKKKKNIFIKMDRKEGIKKGLELAESGDIVLIAGKGHESFQIIGNQSIPFNDFKETQKLLS